MMNDNSKSKHVLITPTTMAQASTEREISNFLDVDLRSLPPRQLDRLRDVGLLPPARDAHAPGGGNDGGNDGVFDDSSRYYAIRLLRDAHVSYLRGALSEKLPRGFASLDASRPWMVYWCLHSLDLLGYFDNRDVADDDDDDVEHILEDAERSDLLRRTVNTLRGCYAGVSLEFEFNEYDNDTRLRKYCPIIDRRKRRSDGGGGTDDDIDVVIVDGGGFGGGPYQMPHCAPTYAAVLSLSIIAGLGGEGDGNDDDEDGMTSLIANAPDVVAYDGRDARPRRRRRRRGGRRRDAYREAGRMALEFLAEIRYGVYAYFLSLRVEYHDDVEGDEGGDGIRRRTAFRMQHDGEVDVRATYCVMAPCYLLGLLDNDDDDDDDDDDGNPLLSPSVSNFVASCQTYEGGFGAEPHNEAHGGYAFCAIASLRLLLHRRGCGGRRKLRQQLGGRSLGDVIDVDALSSWLARRQMGYEGGFSGRTNKLVDGCYSFWQGGATAVLDGYLGEDGRDVDGDGDDDNCEKRSDRRSPTFDEWMLQRYILLCAQDVNGGLRDKPSKGRDFYHSCYNLSGLSVAQHALGPWPPTSGANRLFGEDDACGDEEAEEEDDMVEGKLDERLNRLFGDASVNVVGTTDPVINIRVERVKFMLSRKY